MINGEGHRIRLCEDGRNPDGLRGDFWSSQVRERVAAPLRPRPERHGETEYHRIRESDIVQGTETDHTIKGRHKAFRCS